MRTLHALLVTASAVMTLAACAAQQEDDGNAARGDDQNVTSQAGGCISDTLGIGTRVTKGTCVQVKEESWFQCNGAAGLHDWDLLRGGPNATCKSVHPFGGAKPGGGTQPCSSPSLQSNVPAGTCVQSATGAHAWYRCAGGGAQDWSDLPNGPDSSCAKTFGWQPCESDTLRKSVPAGSCVQDSQGDHPWFQCGGNGPKDWNDVPNGADPSCTKSFAHAP